MYYREVYPILSTEDERKMIIKAQAGDKESFDYLVISNGGLVTVLARKFNIKGMEQDDLIQIGTIGLMKAIEKYDITTNVRLSTFATYCIKRYLIRGIQVYSRTIKVPIHVFQKNYNIMISIKKLEEETGCKPSISEIIERTGKTLKQIKNYQKEMLDTFSLNADYTGSEGGELLSLIADPNDADLTTDMYLQDILDTIRQILNKREYMIFTQRVGLSAEPKTYKEIADSIGITKQGVYKIWKIIVEKLQTNPNIQRFKCG